MSGLIIGLVLFAAGAGTAVAVAPSSGEMMRSFRVGEILAGSSILLVHIAAGWCLVSGAVTIALAFGWTI